MSEITKLKALKTEDFVGEPTKEISRTEDFEGYLQEHVFDAAKVPEANDTVLFYKGIPIGSRSNIITITGKAKSRKTVIASALATCFFIDEAISFLGFHSVIDPGRPILHLDTEQGYRHYYESVMRIFRDAGLKDIPAHFTSVHTRDAEVKFRIELIEYMLEKLKPAALILDGVTDLVYDINDQKEATQVGEKILQWSYKYNLVVITVIHTTKTTGYMTGAIGTYLEKKCQTSIKVEKDEKATDLSHISCQLSRDKSFPDFTITYDEDKGQYVVVNEKDVIKKGPTGDKSPDAYADDIHRSVLNKVFVVRSRFTDYELRRALVNNVKETTGDSLGAKLVIKWIQYYNEKALLFQDPDGGWLRVDPLIAQPTLFKLPPKSGDPSIENNLPGHDNQVDDLPF